MKIAIVSGDDVAGEDPEQLGVALADLGHDVTVYLRRAARRSVQVGADGHYRCRSLGVGPRRPASPLDVLPYVGDWAARLERSWTTQPPDAVHAYGWLGGLAAQLAARRRHIPTVQTFLGLVLTSRAQPGPEQHGERERIEPLLARSANWVTGESNADVDMLARLRRSRAQVSALTGGVDAERLVPATRPAAPDRPRRIVCVAPNPLWHNGIDIAIRALPKVHGAGLVIAETEVANSVFDEARSRLQHIASELGVADRVRFAGTVAEGELPELIRSADALVCTPRQPPRPGTVLQAMASGVAVVAAAVGVLPDVVLDDVTGVVVPPESPAGLASALRNLLAQDFQCESLGACGRSRAQSRFAWQRIALDALNIYQSVVAHAREPEKPAVAR
ncbi:glycosyltransferase [Mycobacterium sp. 94-17]|uniref:glycosyltransferase n=1 Tax=Mycobacterium sp. 94-17 TaxID=2986147 RepID=UPI002D1F47C8|nr:glycosyltransferase [Mycobacterium sp. 94-17]MEB4210167.1 glycosyltransferase [Mycobacterium sp. 94-17]